MKLLAIFFAVFIGSVLSKTIKQDLLDRLTNCQLILSIAQEQYTKQGYDCFAGVLTESLKHLQFIRENVHRLPDDADEKEAYLMIQEVENIEITTPYNVQHPSDDQLYKTGGLYLAAMKVINIDNKKPSPNDLKKEIMSIIKLEDYIDTLGPSAADKIAREVAEKELKGMYDHLLGEIEAGKVPQPAVFQKLQVDAKRKIKELNDEGKKEEAEEMQKALDIFWGTTFSSAKIMPIGDESKVEEMFQALLSQYPAYLKLKSFF